MAKSAKNVYIFENYCEFLASTCYSTESTGGIWLRVFVVHIWTFLLTTTEIKGYRLPTLAGVFPILAGWESWRGIVCAVIKASKDVQHRLCLTQMGSALLVYVYHLQTNKRHYSKIKKLRTASRVSALVYPLPIPSLSYPIKSTVYYFLKQCNIK